MINGSETSLGEDRDVIRLFAQFARLDNRRDADFCRQRSRQAPLDVIDRHELPGSGHLQRGPEEIRRVESARGPPVVTRIFDSCIFARTKGALRLSRNRLTGDTLAVWTQ